MRSLFDGCFRVFLVCSSNVHVFSINAHFVHYLFIFHMVFHVLGRRHVAIAIQSAPGPKAPEACLNGKEEFPNLYVHHLFVLYFPVSSNYNLKRGV